MSGSGTHAGISWGQQPVPDSGDWKVEGSPLQDSRWFKNDSGATIAANMAVFIDETESGDILGRHVTISTAGSLGADVAKFVGVTMESSDDGEQVQVCTGGLIYCEVAAGVAADDPLTIDNVTDGHLETGTVGTHGIVATALEALSATVTGQALVRVYPTM